MVILTGSQVWVVTTWKPAPEAVTCQSYSETGNTGEGEAFPTTTHKMAHTACIVTVTEGTGRPLLMSMCVLCVLECIWVRVSVCVCVCMCVCAHNTCVVIHQPGLSVKCPASLDSANRLFYGDNTRNLLSFSFLGSY